MQVCFKICMVLVPFDFVPYIPRSEVNTTCESKMRSRTDWRQPKIVVQQHSLFGLGIETINRYLFLPSIGAIQGTRTIVQMEECSLSEDAANEVSPRFDDAYVAHIVNISIVEHPPFAKLTMALINC
jgi:hypothetical protein